MSTAQAVTKTTPRRLPALALIAALALAPVVVGSEQAVATTPDPCFPLTNTPTPPNGTAKPIDGNGTGGNPYLITSKEELVWVSWVTSWRNSDSTARTAARAAFYKQDEVIEMARGGVCNFLPIGDGADFTGSYDGQNLAIRDLEIVETEQKVGLFGRLGGEATLQNVRLERAQVVGTANFGEVGTLVGLAEGSAGDIVKIMNSHASGSVTNGTGSNQAITGGLVGFMTAAVIEDSSADVLVDCKVSGDAPCGGLVGQIGVNSHVEDSVARGNVTSLGDYVGGFVGRHATATSTITGSTAEGDVSGVGTVGGFAGQIVLGEITDSQALGASVIGTGSRIGGFVGDFNQGSILESSAEADVEGNGQVGGFAGGHRGSSTADATISASYARGTVTGSSGSIGGLVGETLNGNIAITQSYASGSVTGGGDEVGGLVGSHRGPIDNSYATGSVTNTASGDTGGLVGYSYSGGVITNSYSTGLVTSEDGGTLGGLVGGTGGQTVTNSFWDIETSGQEDSDGGDGKSTAQMTSLATFSGADWKIIPASGFGVPTGPAEEVWGIGSDVNCGYPFLWWQTDSAHDCPSGELEESETPAQTEPTPPGPVASAPAAPAGPSGPSGPDASATPGIHLDVQASVGSPVAGTPVVIGGQGLQPGSAYSLVVRSTPITVASGVASSVGAFSQRVTLPAGIAPGNHTITLRATGSDGSALVLTQSFTVAADGTFSALGPVTGSTTAGLAVTGVNGPLGLGMMSLAALLVFVGVGLMVARRRAEVVSV